MRVVRVFLVLGAFVAGFVGCEGPSIEFGSGPGGQVTLEHLPAGEVFGNQTQAALTAEPSGCPESRVRVSVFFPTPGYDTYGACWAGLAIDAEGFLYPLSGNVSRLSPEGILLNGLDDENFFAYESRASWGVLDVEGRRFFTPGAAAVRAAPFVEGSVFETFAEGLGGQGRAVTLGRGPLADSLLVTDYATHAVYRVRRDSGAVELHAQSPLLDTPEAIASGPDGTVYVASVGSTFAPSGCRVLAIGPKREVRVFAEAEGTSARRMLNVAEDGTVFWSGASGIDRFLPDGRRIAPLPGPNDKPFFENPMGSAFDGAGNFYVLENFGCKKIYKYAFNYRR